jgi:hypothetical protein
MTMHLYVEPMDSVVVEVSDDGRVRLEREGWVQPTLQERRAIIFSAHSEMAQLAELTEILERQTSESATRNAKP